MKTNKNIWWVILILLLSVLVGFINSCTKQPVFKPQVVSITIDDAPNFPENTIKMLDVLKKHNVHATFFCIGEYMVKSPEIMDRMFKEGHIIGNHTYTHVDLKTVNLQEVFIKEIIRTQDLVDSFSHYNGAGFFRPPYGSLTSNQKDYLEHMGYKVRMWDWSAEDWDNNVSVKEIIAYHKDKINNNTLETPIMLFHLSNQSVIALDSVLCYIEQRNIKVVPFSSWFPTPNK